MQPQQFRWDIVWQYREAIGGALLLSTKLAVFSGALGGVLGLALAYASLSKVRALRVAASCYVDLVRNTPLLLFVFLTYLVLPQLGIRGLDAVQTF
ncbi:MAG: ABC transporter permease subunit, partial [Hyphomicrobiales bacterium]